MSDNKKLTDAEEILSEFQQTQEPTPEPEPEPTPEPETTAPEPEPQPEPEPESVTSEPELQPEPEPTPEPEAPVEQPTETTPSQTTEQVDESQDDGTRERNVIFVGTKPIMTYVTATLTQLASQPTVTIKARGKRITQAVDVSQMIVKRMDTVGYTINDVRIASDSLTSQDGKLRNVSTIEIDVTKN